MIRILYDFLNLIYPNVCNICDEKLVFGEKMFCVNCLTDMPKTDFTNYNDNPLSKIFWGRVNIEWATALIYFTKGSKYRVLLHKLKYKGERQIGTEMGIMLGEQIKNYGISNIDLIIPVPLHPRRFRTRGYNQSEYIAEGISEVLSVPVIKNNVKRKMFNITQTGKGRLERWDNVKGIFEATDKEQLMNKHILLVDDIITTGSTIEACATAILEVADCSIGTCSIAFTI